MYSAIKAEVEIDTDDKTKSNKELLNQLFNCKRLIVCGQALSHCVKWTAIDILRDWNKRAKDELESDINIHNHKMFFLTDGSSSVGSFEMSCNDFLDDMVPKYDPKIFDPNNNHKYNCEFSLKNHKVTLTTCDHAFQNL
jgi:hypothetical protein